MHLFPETYGEKGMRCDSDFTAVQQAPSQTNPCKTPPNQGRKFPHAEALQQVWRPAARCKGLFQSSAFQLASA